ncbi:polysaccharide biosynthesis/export family protein [Desulfogranum marinum]|uniref:polysaccharide biosynthesis/export family protein n=1 Tax=Desulfogranum marinum TaxID=453220 RepID=UPI001962A19F|nr:polysaccharide biosynthesis/export family protein [Desulfogranum marinum]MBM9514545.1 polysaccharide biosynthesis/export family protein [Desulfogranum marinum]
MKKVTPLAIGYAVFFIAILFLALPCIAAESTSDVPVDKAMKEQLRQEIMGKQAQAAADDEYIIGYRDILYVAIYGEGSMSVGAEGPSSATAAPEEGGDFIRGRGTGAEVRMDGRMSLKHIGDVYVVGMTLTQLADYLQKIYSSIYESPSVTTTLVQSNSRQYTMMGQIQSPGLFHLDFPLTVVKAVAKAGGFTEWANSEITIIRQPNPLVAGGEKGSDKKGQTFTFDYDDFLKGKDLEKNIMLKPGDIVVVH